MRRARERSIVIQDICMLRRYICVHIIVVINIIYIEISLLTTILQCDQLFLEWKKYVSVSKRCVMI